MSTASREYNTIEIDTTASRAARMRLLVDALWDKFGGGSARHGRGFSWVGFYYGPSMLMDDGRKVGAEEMLLGPCRNKPACSPIGLHGACGRAWREHTALVIRDVSFLGAEYVACDPRDMSEVVVPCFNQDGSCWGVLDVDSFEIGAFSQHDADALSAMLHREGLSWRESVSTAEIG